MSEKAKEPVAIEPTVGRVVWYYPFVSEYIAHQAAGEPCAAIVAKVHGTRLVNLTIFDPNGVPAGRTNVQLVQEGDKVPGGGGYCTWMPYQRGQAAKTDALERKLAEARP
jgi:hypothetical protein